MKRLNAFLKPGLIGLTFAALNLTAAAANASDVVCDDLHSFADSKIIRVVTADGGVLFIIEAANSFTLSKLEEDLGLIKPKEQGLNRMTVSFSDSNCKTSLTNDRLITCSGNFSGTASDLGLNGRSIAFSGKGSLATEHLFQSTESAEHTTNIDRMELQIYADLSSQVGSAVFSFDTEKCQVK